MAEENLSNNQEQQETEPNQEQQNQPVETTQSANESQSVENQTANEQPVTEQQETPEPQQKPMTPAERKKYLKELKAKREAEKKAKEKAEREEKKRLEREQRKANGESGNGKKIIILIIVLVVLGIAGCFVWKNFDNKKIEEEQAKSSEMINEMESNQDELSESEADTVSEPEPVGASETAQDIKSNSNLPFNTPCWLISYASFVNEKYAKINVEKLNKQGKNSNYYWIPDYNPNGNKFFKVYVGPFNSKSEAMANLTQIQTDSPTAYILYLK